MGGCISGCVQVECVYVLTAHTRTFRTNEPRAGLQVKERKREHKSCHRSKSKQYTSDCKLHRSQDEKCNESISSSYQFLSSQVTLFVFSFCPFLSLLSVLFSLSLSLSLSLSHGSLFLLFAHFVCLYVDISPTVVVVVDAFGIFLAILFIPLLFLSL